MQFKEKLMSQTSKNTKKPNFGPDLCPFDPDLVSKFFFQGC